MKTVVGIFVLITFASCGNNQNDSVKQAHDQNLNAAIDEGISEFMTEAADSRMMGIEAGKLAAEKATAAPIREYAQLIISDHNEMLKELRMLAGSKNIVLPNTVSNKNARTLEDLRELTEENFDDRFINVMKKELRVAEDEFDDATDVNDQNVRLFAEKYLPVVKSHLTQIKNLEE